MRLAVGSILDAGSRLPAKGVRLTFRLKEMPSWIPWAGFSYTEEDGFSAGPKLSALNLTGRGVSLSWRAYFGGATQYATSLSWPWIGGAHVSFDFYGARLNRADTLNEIEETSYEFTPQVGRYLPDALQGWGMSIALGRAGDPAWVALGVSLGVIGVALMGAVLIFRRQEI